MSKSQDTILAMMRDLGRADALSLRSRANDLDGTALIAEEAKVPPFDPGKDYSAWLVGAPVEDGGQVYRLLQPHNAAHYPDSRPATTPALWSITHTKDPARAKPYLAPNGTSGLYMTGEVAVEASHLWRSKKDDNPHLPGATGTKSWWEDLGEVSDYDTGEG